MHINPLSSIRAVVLALGLLPLPGQAESSAAHPPLSFVRDILPVLSKAGCNAGDCHAKPNGQNGFKLSVFAHDPQADFEEITREAGSRRISKAHPTESLILKKPTKSMSHEGGRRFPVDSPEYRLLHAWIQQGAPYRQPDEPTLTHIQVEPEEVRFDRSASQPLTVTAHYSDDSTRDVTHLAGYEAPLEDVMAVSESGLMQKGHQTGIGVVVVRYMGQVQISRGIVPAENPIDPERYSQLPALNFIDELAYKQFEQLGLFPSELCSDATFLRRAYLDITGTLPTAEETKTFLEDENPQKRSQLVNHLLDQPAYAEHWAIKWADLIRPNPSRVGVKSVLTLDQWIRQSFRENKPYDHFVREILTATGSAHDYGPTVIYRDRREPAELATLVSQVFLGVRMECARCHHHPNEKWSQQDFYEMAAFFGEVKRKGPGISPPISGGTEFIFHSPGGKVTHPVTEAVMKPRPLAAGYPDQPPGVDPRRALSDWTLSPDNPYFAPAAVNRVWAALMGRGLVDPVDDFRASNPPSNPALLDRLAEHFIAVDYDLKQLIRTITGSRLYQLSSDPNDTNVRDTTYFSRGLRKRLPAEVLLNAVSQVLDHPINLQGLPAGMPATAAWNNKLNSDFLDAFGRPDSSADCPCERQEKPSLVQSLHLMNSTALHTQLAGKNGRAARLAKSKADPEELAEQLYLATLNRFPSPEEIAVCQSYLASSENRQAALEDIQWALINSAEFVFKH